MAGLAGSTPALSRNGAGMRFQAGTPAEGRLQTGSEREDERAGWGFSTRGRPVGGEKGRGCGQGRRWGYWLVRRVEGALISQESTTKPQHFYIQKKRRWPLSAPPPRRHTLPWFVFSKRCHVLPGLAGSQRPSLALTFGTSETQSEGGGGFERALASSFDREALLGERNAVVKGQNEETSKRPSWCNYRAANH